MQSWVACSRRDSSNRALCIQIHRSTTTPAESPPVHLVQGSTPWAWHTARSSSGAETRVISGRQLYRFKNTPNLSLRIAPMPGSGTGRSEVSLLAAEAAATA
eukprot:6191071-Pleurochrysis_carterae.AAC.3